jgi:hypothetical protein
VLLWGPPGSGKTSAVKAMAAASGLPVEVVIAAIREPSDFSGLPVVVDGEVHFAPPAWARRLAAARTGILFFDEISTAPPAVQAALLRVVLDRWVGDLELPPDVVLVAAANPPEQAAGGWDLAAPLANRFCHLDWPADAAVFAEGIAGHWPDPAVAHLPARWEAALPEAQGLVSAFIAARPTLLCAVPDDAAAAGGGWPSPRSWEMVTCLWTAANAAGAPPAVRNALVAGCVGPGAGTEFLSWVARMDLPDPEAVLASADRFRLPKRGDRALAVLAAVAAAVVARNTPERWTQAWQVIARAAEERPDVAAVAARVLAANRPKGAAAPAEIRALAPVLRAAGLLRESA